MQPQLYHGWMIESPGNVQCDQVVILVENTDGYHVYGGRARSVVLG